MTEPNEVPYIGRDRRSGTHEHLVESILAAMKVNYPPPACLTDEEQQWVRMAIKDQAERSALRKAVIEKSLAGLVWSGLVGLGYIFIDYLKAHGFK